MMRQASTAGFHSSSSALPENFVECECGHFERYHADADYDFDGEGYVACPRPCSVCDCPSFWSGQ
jgi:hypothetical protein